MAKKKRVFIIILCIAIGLTIGVIWGNSIMSKTTSKSQSMGVYDVVEPVFNAVLGKGVVTHSIFRKLAHVFEFFVLTVEINLLCLVVFNAKWTNMLLSFLVCFSIAGIDEIIQIFSARGSLFTDVLIDCIGGAVASLIFILVTFIIKRKTEKNKG